MWAVVEVGRFRDRCDREKLVAPHVKEAAVANGLNLPGAAEGPQSLVVADRPPTWGTDWLESLATIAPGHEGGLATRFHHQMYGSSRGAVGLMTWESLALNFGWFGIVCGGFVLGALLQWLTLRSWSGERLASKHVFLLFSA